jgi:hypothetical protein
VEKEEEVLLFWSTSLRPRDPDGDMGEEWELLRVMDLGGLRGVLEVSCGGVWAEALTY